MLKSYFKIAWRNLKRNKIYSVINIVGLSLGLACAMLIILYTKDELSYDRFHKNVENIYRIVHTRINPSGGIESQGGNTGTFQGPKFSAAIPEMTSFVRFNAQQREIKRGDEIINREIYVADSNFLSVFNFPMISGSRTTALKQPNSVVISEKMAVEQFGTTDAIGKTILFNEEDKLQPFQVTAVIKNIPQNSSIRFDMVMPLQIEDWNENWGNFYINTFVTLRPGANIQQVEAKMKQVFETDAKTEIEMWAREYNDKNKIVHSLQPLTSIHLSEKFSASNGLVNGSNTIYSYILSGIAVFILLIACINFINLTVARSVKRAKEIGIRKVVGSDRKRLIIQFLGESFLLCFAAFVLAIVLVQAVLPTFNQLANKALYLSYLFDVKLVAGYVALFLVTGLLAGFYPALVLSNYNPVQTLYNRFALAGKNYLQKSLVVLQFALATLLVIATITIYKQFNYLTKKELGYDDKNVVLVERWDMNARTTNLVKEELLKNPNIAGVAFRNGGRRGTRARVNGDKEVGFDYETITEDYLPLYKIPVVKGKNFTGAPYDSAHYLLVNEAFAKEAGWKDPIGQTIDFWYNKDEKYTVLGVVKDYHFRPLSEKIGPQVFNMKFRYGLAIIKIKPNTESASLKHIEKVFRKTFPVSSFNYTFKDAENLKNYESEAKWKQMILFGAIVTIFISCIGLFGLSVLAAEKRMKEIGIRKVLGASVSRIVSTLSTDFLKLVTIAMLIAIPIAWFFANKWLENYPYRITLNWIMFAGAAILIGLIALATVSFQAIRAAVSNPVKSLRSE